MRKSSLLFLLIFTVSLGATASPIGEFPASVYGDITVETPGQGNPEAFSSGEVVVKQEGEYIGSLEYKDSSFGGPSADTAKLLVDTTGEVNFYVNGIQAQETLNVSAGEIYEKDLTVEITDRPRVVSANKGPSDRPEIEVPDVAESNSQVKSVSADLSSSKTAGFSVELNSDVPEEDEISEDYEVSATADINPEGFENSDIDSATVSFRVDESNFEDPSQVYILHYEDSEWNRLDTSLVEGTDNLFEAPTDSFSPYAVGSDTQDPEANIVADASSIDEGEEVEFDGSESSDNVGIESYSWDFDDGESATGETVTHTFVDPGDYDVELTVTDESGNTDTEMVRIEVDSVDTGSSTTNVASDDTEEQQPDQEDQTEEETGQTDESSDQQSEDQTSEQSNDQQDNQGQSETTEETDSEPETPPNEQGNTQTPTGLFSAENSGLIGIILLVLFAAVAYAQRTGRIDLQSYYSSLADKVARQETDSTSQEYEFK